MTLTIGRKLLLSFGALALLIAAIGVLSLHQGRSAARDIEALSSAADELALNAAALKQTMTAKIEAGRFLSSGSPEARRRFDEALSKASAKFNDKEAAHADPVVAALLTEYRQKLSEFETSFNQAAAALADRDHAFTQEMRTSVQEVIRLVEAVARASTDAKKPETAAAALQLLADINACRSMVLRFMISGDNADQEAMTALMRKVSEAFPQVAALVTGAELASVRDAITGWDRYLAAAQRFRDRVATLTSIRTTRLGVLGPELSTLSTRISSAIEERSNAIEAHAAAASARSRVTTLAISLVALTISVLAALLITRSIVAPLRSMTVRLREIAQGDGDLTQRVDDTRADELGELGRWFNQFVTRIQDLIRQVGQTTAQVAAAATQIAASAEEMATGLKTQEGQTTQVSAAVEEMAQSVTEVARKGAEAARAAQDAGTDAATGGQVVESTVVEMKAISEQVNESAKAVADLGKKSEAIGQIIGVINDIADQTNLLALNAAIEAARAGEHGRGFAVVADEVRKLAERTTQATDEVAKSIREIQGETGRAVERINAGTQRVTSGVELASRAGDALGRIVAGSQTVQAMVHAIAAAAEEQSAASEQIARSVESVSAVTRESNRAAAQSAEAAAKLSTQAERLSSLVNQFKV